MGVTVGRILVPGTTTPDGGGSPDPSGAGATGSAPPVTDGSTPSVNHGRRAAPHSGIPQDPCPPGGRAVGRR